MSHLVSVTRYLLALWFTLTLLFGANTEDDIKALPDCSSKSESLDSLVLVSLIDGRLFALNGNNGGSEVWNVGTGPGPMLSSSIHNLELGRDGHFLRMIPSLSGRLYQFNGENVELIPFTADDLLQSSFRFKDDIILTGGKESRTYGVDARKGTIIYECSMKGCENLTSNSSDAQEIIVLKRLTHTVRAVEPRTSQERWNFSVARHNVKLISDPAALCHGDKAMPLNFNIHVIVPDGLVCGVSRSDPKVVLWQHKFDSPIVSAWLMEGGDMKEVDLFSGSDWKPHDANNHDSPVPISPSLYVGMHHKQLYIEESVQMLQQIGDSPHRQNRIKTESTFFRIPWLPVPAMPGNSLGLIEHESDGSKLPQITHKTNQAVRTTAMSVLYASEYVNGNGFFLYSAEALKDSHRAQCGLVELESNESSETLVEDQITGPVKKPLQPLHPGGTEEENIIITSLWYWWKEVLLISVGTAVLVNCMLPRGVLHIMRLRRPLELVTEEGKILPLVHTPWMDIPPLEVAQEERPATPVDFTSRYLQEFQPVQCLGKGGFGVVFEARKKFDDCHYAVKRISLTNKEDSRERVLREVRALAKLDHNNIVRYFNSWLECPPPGWQEEQDKQWGPMLNTVNSLTSGEKVSYSEERCSSRQSLQKRHRVGLINSVDDSSSESLNQSHILNIHKLGRREPSSNKMTEVSDSYIVFNASGSDGDVSDAEEGLNDTDLRKDSAILLCDSSSSSILDTSVCVPQRRCKEKQKWPDHIDLSSNQKINISKSYLFIQMQLCRKDNLKDWLRSHSQRDYLIVINFFEQIVMAVEYVHLNNLIHRDLKPSNIFFSMDGHIKIGDFGLVTTMLEGSEEQRIPLDGSGSSSSLGEHHTAQVGTELYMSPEQRRGKPYNYKVDIYSLGLILFELLVPFGTEMERVHVMQDLHLQRFPKNFSENFKSEYDLLKMMLDHHPEKRPTTFGIRARSPLRHRQTEEALSDLPEEYHFELPTRQRSSSSFHKLSSSSASSLENNSFVAKSSVLKD